MKDSLPYQEVPTLEIKNLSISFDDGEDELHIIKDLNFALYKNEITVLIGETGSGKTITGLALMGLLKANINLSLNNPKLKNGRDIAMIFQDPMASFSPVRKIKNHFKDVIALAYKIKQRDYSTLTKEMFVSLGLENIERFMNSYPHEVSGGELQRISIVLALIQRPAILIADEPAAALDNKAKNDLFELLKKMCSTLNMSILLITHDLHSTQNIASNILVLFEGKIVERGRAIDLFNHPKHSYTKQLIKSMLQSVSTKYEKDNKIINHDPILSLENVSVNYLSNEGSLLDKKEIQALSSLSLDLYKGECLGIYGHSGSGKSTLLSAIVQLVNYKGEIRFKGKNILSLGQKTKKSYSQKIQYIFQNPNASLNPRFTVEKTLLTELKMLHPVKNSKFHQQEIKNLLADVLIDTSLLKRFPHELSGGQKQRVCIARALVFKPDILLCDEILSSLDSNVQRSILDLIKSLIKSYGMTVVFVSHDLDAIRYISDRMIQLKMKKVD